MEKLRPRAAFASAAIALALLAAAPLGAQRARVNQVPPRPVLFAGADTNSATAYYLHGSQVLAREPARAAAAFYWAHRLNPRNADALYGRRIALHMADPNRLIRYMEGVRGTIRSPEVMAIDSLHLRALTMDPFLVERFDLQLFTEYLTRAFAQELAREGENNVALASHYVQLWLNSNRGNPYHKVRYAAAQGRYPHAIAEYERLLPRARENKALMRTELGRLHFLSGNLEQALTHFALALTEFRERDEREVVYVYESKALIEHSRGAIYEKGANLDAAREAYGRALTEDLAYYPAHQRLGWLALEAGDTAAAVSELALAAEAAPRDGVVQMEYGVMLALAKRMDDAQAALRKSVELEPYFAAPRLVLARLLDAAGKPEAVDAYRAFLERTTRDDPQRAGVQARLDELGGAAGSGQ